MKKLEELQGPLNELLATATRKVRPTDRMIKFYNRMGQLPLKIGMITVILTSLDAIRVIKQTLRGHTDAAIQVLYEYRSRPWIQVWRLGDRLWQNSYNCRSVRSRGLFTREAVRFLLGELNGLSIVASLGSGSASQMLQGIADNHLGNKEIRLILVDNDFNALKTGRRNALRLGIEDLIDFRGTTVGKFLRWTEVASVNLVEMVGLADYFNEEKFQPYLKEIYRILGEDGLFLGANISSKEESVYAHNVACWPKMYYRSDEQIRQSLETMGFHQIWTGQCGLYTVWLAQK